MRFARMPIRPRVLIGECDVVTRQERGDEE